VILEDVRRKLPDKILFKGVDKPGTCELKNLSNGKATTLVREYKAYLEAYKYLAR
jgi:hypothetical protein